MNTNRILAAVAAGALGAMALLALRAGAYVPEIVVLPAAPPLSTQSFAPTATVDCNTNTNIMCQSMIQNPYRTQGVPEVG